MRGARAFLLVVACSAVPLGLQTLSSGAAPSRTSIDVRRQRRSDAGLRVARSQAPAIAAPVVTAPVTPATVPPPTTPPPPPPQRAAQYCAPRVPSSAAALQAAFDALRQAGTGWVSADGAVPIDLPDGRTVWTFGDTYVGASDPSGQIGSGDLLVRNSFVVQAGPCFTPQLGGSVLAPGSLIPEPGPNEWFWPSSGVVDGGLLRIFLWHMQQVDGSVPTLDFHTLDMRVATFSLPDLTLLGVQALPFPTSADRPYGATAFAAPDGDVYLYGMSGRNVYATRAPLGSLLQPHAWTFSSGDPATPSWIPDPQQARPLEWRNLPALLGALGTGEGPAAQPWVTAYGSGFLATAKLADGFSDDVSVFTAASPRGPWTYLGPIASTTAPGLAADGAMLRTPAVNPIVIYSTAPSPFVSTPPPLTVQDYGPHFEAPSVALPPPLP